MSMDDSVSERLKLQLDDARRESAALREEVGRRDNLLRRAYNVCYDETESMLETCNPTDVMGTEQCTLVLAIGDLLKLPKGRAALTIPSPAAPAVPGSAEQVRDAIQGVFEKAIEVGGKLRARRTTTPEQREAPATCEICSKYDMEVSHPATQPTATKPCERCGGSGTVVCGSMGGIYGINDKRCPTCHGEGKVPA